MMNKFLRLLATLGLGLGLTGQTMAQDSSFEREFSKFDKDFERLNNWKADTPASRKMQRAPSTPTVAPQGEPTEAKTTPLEEPVNTRSTEPAAPKTEVSPTDHSGTGEPSKDKTSGLPKGAKVEKLSRNDRLGNQISDPEMRKKVQALYRRQDVVVQQYVLPTN